MSKKRAIIMVKTDPPWEQEAEWSDWYNNKHIADRLNLVPGFITARRFTKIEGIPKDFAIKGEAKYLALYELISADVLKSEAYIKLREQEKASDRLTIVTLKLPNIARGIYEQIYPTEGEYQPPPTKFLFVVGHDVPRNKQQEFNAWYNTEHVPATLRVPGFVTARRFVLAKGEFAPLPHSEPVPQYLTVYDIESEKVFDSEAFRKSSVSPWSTWVRSWFTRRICATYRRIYPED